MRKSFLLILTALVTTLMSAQPTTMTYDVPGTETFSVPAGYTATVRVRIWGAGGGGGDNPATNGAGGGGGGAFTSMLLVLGSGDYEVVVGAGGMEGVNGENSSFDGTSVVALGGEAGILNAGGAGGMASLEGDTTFAGGYGGSSNGVTNYGGGGGGEAAGPDGAGDLGNNNSGDTGGQGGTGQGSGGDGGDGGNEALPGMDGSSPGGGGGGKSGNGTGLVSGNGGDGLVQVIVIDYLLPIQLFSFSAASEDRQIILTWSTASEINNDFMEVERSADGIHFTGIGRVSGYGTTNQIQDYHFTDFHPFSGINYYRLRQVDIDGISTYHKIISIEMAHRNPGYQVKAYPNPTREYLSLTWDNYQETTLIRVFDMTGHVHLQQVAATGVTQIRLPVSLLPSGNYVVQVQSGETNEMVRFQKN